VARDEFETGDRALLNFGHTFAHALESACNYDRRVLHGEAVSIGMSLAFQTSSALGICPDTDATRAISHLQSRGLPTRIDDIAGFPDSDANALLELMSHDKKVEDGKMRFILTRGIGTAFISRDTDINIVRNVIQASL